MDQTKAKGFCELVQNEFEDEVHFAYQALSEDEDLLHELADSMEEKIRDMGDNYRLLRVDLNAYAEYDDLIEDLLKKTFSDSKFEKSDTRMRIEGDNSKNWKYSPEFMFNCILTKDFPNRDIFTLILIEHYEKAAEIWDSTAFGNLRALLCDSRNTSIVVTSYKTMKEISEQPVGSSPLYNIFEIMRVER